MFRPSRSLSIAGTLALTVLLVARAAPEARAQIFHCDVQDPGWSGRLGWSVARIGDVDGDGCEDFAVGEPFFPWGGIPVSGAIRLESGKTGSQIVPLYGDAYSQFGWALDGRIDVDGDGHDDVLFGAPDEQSVITGGGLFGAYSPYLRAPLFVSYGSSYYESLGSSIRSLHGDLDGDGIEDFVVGAQLSDTAYVISSKFQKVLFQTTGQTGSNFGSSVCSGGDLDNDGIVDFLVGSPDHVDASGKASGEVTAYSGKTGLKLWAVLGAADSKFGTSITLPGDLDGDGQGDIVVGAPQHLDAGGINMTGCATVLSGATHSVLYKVYGDGANDTFGWDVHTVEGDIDDDGTVDFIVGAPQLLGSYVGYARTISGATGAALFTYHHHTYDPATTTEYGFAVCGGDFDGDGRTDVAIGGSNFNYGDGIVEVWSTAVARWSNYGSGWPGTNGVPAFTARFNPAVGMPLDLDLADSSGASTTGLLVFGLSEASIPTGKGGTLLVTPFEYLPLSIPAGGLTLSGQVPNDPSLYGFELFLQALELDRGASKGLSFSQGLDLFFGFN
jgi:hypothetical protein